MAAERMAGNGQGDGGAAGATPRRGLLAGALALGAAALGGCGFRPLHGGAGGGLAAEPTIAAELAATRVGYVGDRFGQLLRRSLQQRLGVGGAGGEARWELEAAPNFATDAAGFLPDGSATRVRYIATANWTLRRLSSREAVANGFERAIEAYNIPPNQYFAADASRDATERRMAEQLADEVVTRVALRFRTLHAGEPARLIPPVEPPVVTEPPLPGSPLGLPPSLPGGGLDGGIGGGTPGLLR